MSHNTQKIMAIHQEDKQTIAGTNQIRKRIDEGAEDFITNLVQRDQYSYPILSLVRECLCNGFDSIAEKNAAREILTGTKKVEEIFADLGNSARLSAGSK